MKLISILPLFLSLILSANAAPTELTISPAGVVVVKTPYGDAKGVPVGDGSVVRFVVKYATASRFGNPVQSKQWIGLDDPAALPPTCPQTIVDPSGYSEDCLYAIAYVPRSVMNRIDTAPIFVWIHGGSFVGGSATQPGLVGTKLALKMKGIVVYIQYRVGVLGFLPPSSETAGGNLGVKDAITALQFIKTVESHFGGNKQVTVGGQSSGAHMVRALLGSPSANDLFRSAVLHGDPMAYGFIKQPVYTALQTSFYSNLTNPQTMAVSDLLAAQATFVNTGLALAVDPSVGVGEELRPHVDGTTIAYSLTTTYPPVKKPLLITHNKNEAGQVVGGYYPKGMNTSLFPATVAGWTGADRAAKIIASPWYDPTKPEVLPTYLNNSDVTRQAVERVLTDQLWRCPNWDFAKRWAKAGGSAYAAVFEVGATYPGNQANDYCTEPGMVCHEDEKYIIFGSTPNANATAAQIAVSNEWQARLTKFITNPSQGPNPSPYAHWAPATASNAKTIQLGGAASGKAAPLGACAPTFWGSAVPFDWQVFGE